MTTIAAYRQPIALMVLFGTFQREISVSGHVLEDFVALVLPWALSDISEICTKF